MNRSKDMQILGKNPEAAGDMAKAIRRGIVKGFFAVKNFDKKLTEEKIRALYKVPKEYSATWLKDGIVFSFCDRDITVKQDGTARESHMALSQAADSHVFTDEEWEP